MLDRGLEHEVADFLIARGETALLVSQKCQGDPTFRSPEKTRAWAAKSTAKAVAQFKGALPRVGSGDTIRCDHLRRGRGVRRRPSQMSHAVVTVEVFERTELTGDLPLEHCGTAITCSRSATFLT